MPQHMCAICAISNYVFDVYGVLYILTSTRECPRERQKEKGAAATMEKKNLFIFDPMQVPTKHKQSKGQGEGEKQDAWRMKDLV